MGLQCDGQVEREAAMKPMLPFALLVLHRYDGTPEVCR